MQKNKKISYEEAKEKVRVSFEKLINNIQCDIRDEVREEFKDDIKRLEAKIDGIAERQEIHEVRIARLEAVSSI